MRITHLGVTSFKNYARLELDLPPGTTVIYGENAQGKTSFLEAIYYLAGGRSLGSQTDTQLINWVAQQSGLVYARLVAQVQREQSPPASAGFSRILFSSAMVKQKAALTAIAAEKKKITDQFTGPTQPTGAREVALLNQLFALGQKQKATTDSFSATLARDKKTISADAATANKWKAQG